MTTDTTGCIKKSRGRPKVFDRDAALDIAMTLFWQHGYEATSLSHLVSATGAKAPTLYAEFTNKEGLFRAVLERYVMHFTRRNEAQLFCDEKNVRQALSDYLMAVARSFTNPDSPQGCFMITTSSALGASSKQIAAMIRAHHAEQSRMLIRFLTERKLRGELPEHCQPEVLGNYLSCLIRGMSVSAREGECFQTLKQLIDTTLRILPYLAD